ncbi:MAG: tRNA (adenosine(37)-N6)-dimethylallyltransferase MiaA, partial [Bacteroidia bacterium]|nr:tRNA (adenosine(37)-N6)-dimethylallyltransferase MiaA [Bacteroidia bacterium]
MAMKVLVRAAKKVLNRKKIKAALNKTLLVIAGPTAVGKTGTAINIAKHFQTEIISADSRQFYREMTVGTAKPISNELQAVKHHFINSDSIHDNVNAGQYGERCRELIIDLHHKYDTLIMCGGSGLFINSAIFGLDELPEKDDAIRSELQSRFEHEGIEVLQNELKAIDPEMYKVIDKQNPRRLIRAIEVNRQSDIPYSKLLGKNTVPKVSCNVIYVGLNIERDDLYDRIDKRVDQMI